MDQRSELGFQLTEAQKLSRVAIIHIVENKGTFESTIIVI